jgi:capsular polysaccharide biosynthesis protein
LERRYYGVETRTLIETGGHTNLIPLHLPEDHVEMLKPFAIGCETVLLNITNQGFSFRNHVLHDPDLNILHVDTEPAENVLSLRRYVPAKCRVTKGTVAYLSNTWVDNYYHWMQLTLPLLRLYRKLARDTKIDYYYVGESGLQSLQEETLARFGIVPEQILREPCRADRLLAAIYLHRPQHGARFRDIWGHNFIRAMFELNASQRLPRRIYVERGPVRQRKVANERELIQFLRKFGFVPVSLTGMTCREQAQLFANAEVIVAYHGAALTNIAFAQQNAKVIEIFTPAHLEPSFFVAATYSQVEYYYVLACPPSHGSQYDISIDPCKLARVFDIAGVRQVCALEGA